MIGKEIHHYKITDKIGEGGMGIVYRAQDTKLDRTVAVKFLPHNVSDDEETKKRFYQEAKAAAALNHPNIMSVHEINEFEGSVFLVMEFIEGETLKDHLAKLRTGSGLPIGKAIEWAVEVGQGLRAAHEKNIVHRDIKPENIMITKDGRLTITDFGLAKLKNSQGLTRTGSSMGTLGYMAPEQVKGQVADHRCDLWALGVVLYEMLTGEVPFKAEHEAALLYLISNEEPPSPSAFDRKIPHQVDEVVKRMMMKDRALRFQGAGEVIEALQSVKKEIENSDTSSKRRAIAVLPFENISADKENEYFGDGLAEELIVNLSRLKDIEVVSRTTSSQYKGTKKDIKTIGRELGARYILEGSVRKFQDNLRIAAQLIDVEVDRQLWAESYKGKLEDVFDIQEQVSRQIVDALLLKLSPTEKVVLTKRATLNAEAFDVNLRARDFLYRLTKNNVHLAIQLFKKAIELDPRYASAHAGLGEAYATLYQYFEAQDDLLDKAIESSLKALMYDPTLSEAYAALGLAYFDKKALDEGITATLKAIELDPNNYVAYWILGRIYHTTDRDREAAELFRKTLELNPNFYNAYNDLGMVYDKLGEKELHSKTLKKILEFFPEYLSKHPDDARAHMYHAIHLAQVDRPSEAKTEGQKALELNPGDSLMMYNAACLYSRLGETKLAVETLKNAIDAGQEDFEWIKRDSDLDPIRNDPAFVELMRKHV